MMFSLNPTTLIILSSLPASTFTYALPTTKTRPCTNTVTNPSFATGSLTPWLDMVTGSWSSRGITNTPSNLSGPYIYTAHSNSTTVTATLTLSQSYITIPDYTSTTTTSTVECYTYVRTDRPTGQTRVQVFLDALSCGEAVALGPGEGGKWTRVGGRVVVGEGDKVVGHTVAVSVQGDGVVGGAGWRVDVGEVGIGVGEEC